MKRCNETAATMWRFAPPPKVLSPPHFTFPGLPLVAEAEAESGGVGVIKEHLRSWGEGVKLASQRHYIRSTWLGMGRRGERVAVGCILRPPRAETVPEGLSMKRHEASLTATRVAARSTQPRHLKIEHPDFRGWQGRAIRIHAHRCSPWIRGQWTLSVAIGSKQGLCLASLPSRIYGCLWPYGPQFRELAVDNVITLRIRAGDDG